MQLNTQIFGHVALASPATPAMEKAEEENEMTMLRCRFAKTCFVSSWISCAITTGYAAKRMHNPSTLRDLAEIFGTTLDHAYCLWGNEPRLSYSC